MSHHYLEEDEDDEATPSPKPADAPLVNSLGDCQSAETRALIEQARLQAQVDAAREALSTASKKAREDRAVLAAIAILSRRS